MACDIHFGIKISIKSHIRKMETWGSVELYNNISSKGNKMAIHNGIII